MKDFLNIIVLSKVEIQMIGVIKNLWKKADVEISF